MEHLKGLSQVNRSSNGIAEAIDLTLRLGLPYNYDPQNPIKIQLPTLPMKQETNNIVVVASNEAFETESSSTFAGSQSPPFVGVLSGGMMRKCKECGNEKSPLWRKGPDGPQTLCNACGLRYARLLKKQNIS